MNYDTFSNGIINNVRADLVSALICRYVAKQRQSNPVFGLPWASLSDHLQYLSFFVKTKPAQANAYSLNIPHLFSIIFPNNLGHPSASYFLHGKAK